MKIYSYVVARDYGFAPNPFYGFCTLATCKPDIRKHASRGDWVVGTGSAESGCQGYLVFAMKVEEILCFDSYWRDEKFACKKPLLNGSLKQIYGDNIYYYDGEKWVQENSHHSLENGNANIKNIINDTGKTDNVLISNKFVYFGKERKIEISEISSALGIKENLCKKGPGYKYKFSQETVKCFTDWIETYQSSGLQGFPFEFSKAKKAYYVQ